MGKAMTLVTWWGVLGSQFLAPECAQLEFPFLLHSTLCIWL